MRTEKEFTEQEDEDVKAGKLIKDFIDTDWSSTAKEKGQAVNLFKGLIYSESPKAQKFIEELDRLTSGMDAEKYAEGGGNQREGVTINEDFDIPGTEFTLEEGDVVVPIEVDNS